MENLNSYSIFRVKTTGYVEQFSNYNSARQCFDKLKRKKMKDGEPFKIVLEGKGREGLFEAVDSINIKD